VFPCGFDDAAVRGENWIIATHCMVADRRAEQQCSSAAVCSAASGAAGSEGLRPLAKGARIPGKHSDGFGMGVRHAATAAG
jgi:hypothetical protein